MAEDKDIIGVNDVIDSEKIKQEIKEVQDALVKLGKEILKVKDSVKSNAIAWNELESSKKKVITAADKARLVELQFANALQKAENEARKLEAQTDKLNKAKERGAKNTNTWSNALTSFQNKFNTLGNLIGGAVLGAFTALGAGVVKVFKNITNATEGISDSFKIMVAGWTSGMGEFFRMLASGNWSNFIGNIKEAIKVGREYAEVLDNLEERNRVLRVTQAEHNLLNEQDKRIYKDATKTRTERIAAIDKILAREKELTALRKDIAEKEMNIELKVASQQSKLSKEQILNYIDKFEQNENLRKQAEEYNKLVKEQINLELESKKQAFGQEQGFSNFDPKRLETVNGLLANTSAEVKNMSVLMKGINNLNAEGQGSFDNLTKAIAAVTEAEALGIAETQRAAASRSSMIKDIEDENKKLKENAKKETKVQTILGKPEDAKKAFDEFYAIQQAQNNKELEDLANQLANKQLTIEQYNQRVYDTTIAQLEVERDLRFNFGLDVTELDKKISEEKIKNAENVAKNADENIDRNLKKEQDAFDKKMKYLNDIGNAANIISQIQQNNANNEITRIENRYTRQIKAAKAAKKDTTALEEQMAEEISVIKNKAAKKQYYADLLQAAIDGTMATIKAFKDYGLPGGIAMGILQTALFATLASKPIPEYWKGGKNLEGLAIVGDRYGEELIKTPSGELFMTPDKPTKVMLPKGSDVIPNKDISNYLQNERKNNNDVIIKELKATREAIVSKPSMNITQGGIELVSENKNQKIKYLNTYLRK